MRTIIFITLLMMTTVLSCKKAEEPKAAAVKTITVTSSAFKDGETIPVKYTCDDKGVSPPLAWRGLPGHTKCLVLICDDPDAPRGTFTHWVVWGIPLMGTNLPEGLPPLTEMAGGMKQGLNSAGKIGYTGPCPPPGKIHHYNFRFYALDIELNLSNDADKLALEAAMKSHIIAEGKLVGTYGR